jgi:hypothetical protein
VHHLNKCPGRQEVASAFITTSFKILSRSFTLLSQNGAHCSKAMQHCTIISLERRVTGTRNWYYWFPHSCTDCTLALTYARRAHRLRFKSHCKDSELDRALTTSWRHPTPRCVPDVRSGKNHFASVTREGRLCEPSR